MPVYEYRCTFCSYLTAGIRCIKDRNAPLDCEKCGAPTRLEVSPVRGKVVKPAVPRKVRK